MNMDMELEKVRGNTWVLKSWELIPVYRIDERRCVLLDTGLARQQAALDRALERFGLLPVGIICSHAHIDHMGNNAFLMQKYGAKLAMSLGEAGHQFSYLGLNAANFVLSPNDVEASPDLKGTPCLADRVIMPTEDTVVFCGVTFGILHTPGHTTDHICVRTPDDVLYLGDAMMTGRTLHDSKFPFAFSMQGYLDSMRLLRNIPAAQYIVAHYGVYDEVLPLVDMELRFLTQRMLDLLKLVDGYTTPKRMASAICRAYGIDGKNIRNLAYFEAVSLTYINYLRDLGYLDPCIEDNQIRYRCTEKVEELDKKKAGEDLPPAGLFR